MKKKIANTRPAPPRDERDIIVEYMSKYFKRVSVRAQVTRDMIPAGVSAETFIRNQTAIELAETIAKEVIINKAGASKFEVSLDIYIPAL